MSNKDFLDAALAAVKKAEPVFLKHFGRPQGVSKKPDTYQSSVTDADKEIEGIISSYIISHFKDHDIVGEELPPRSSSSKYCWYIDPIDGTINYIRGLPVASISVGLWEAERPVVGVVLDPVAGTSYSASCGGGAFKNRKERMSVNKISNLKDAIGTVGRANAISKSPGLDRVVQSVYRGRIYGGSALELCYIAEGKLDFQISEDVKIYDVAASALILTEAGGKVTDWQGKPFSPKSTQVVSSSGGIHGELLNLLNQ